MSASTACEGLTVASIMHKDPVTIPSDCTTSEAIIKMSTHGIRHLVVVSSVGTIVGLVSQRDIFRSLAQWGNKTTPIHKLMSSPVVWVSSEMPVSEASQYMCTEKIGCLVVYSPEKQLVGIVTRSDLLSLLHSS